MALYSNKQKVLEFTYRKINVVVVNATKGAECCGQDRPPHLNHCTDCGKKLEHQDVTLVLTDNKVIMMLDRVTPLKARRDAEDLIDRVLTRIEEEGPSDETDDKNGKRRPGQGKQPPGKRGRKQPPPRRPPPKHRPPPPALPPADSGEEGDEPDFPEPPPGMDLSGTGHGLIDQADLASLIELCKALGWGEQAKEIVDQTRKKRRKP